MEDLFNRKITYLRLSVTDRCNFKCSYCMPENKRFLDNILSFDELYDICKAAINIGVRKIRLTGGEPLVRDGIIDFCKRLSAIESLNELVLTTNGCLLEEYALDLYNSGVTRINISLDTLDESRFKQITKTDYLSKVLRGIKTAQTIGFRQVKINTVLINGFNIDEIKDFVEMTKDSDISVRFIELMPIGDIERYSKQYIPADVVLKEVPSLKSISFDGVSHIYKVDGYRGTVGLIRPMSDKFCDICNRIRITCDGKIKTCLHSKDEYDLKGLEKKELENAIKSAIINKPSSHSLSTTCFSESMRFMNEIGG